MGEEVGSIGLQELCEANREGLLKADLLIASDGPRIRTPTLFLDAALGPTSLDTHAGSSTDEVEIGAYGVVRIESKR